MKKSIYKKEYSGDRRYMSAKEKILSYIWIDDVSEEADGIFVYCVHNAHFPSKDGLTKEQILENPELLKTSCIHVYRADTWREALYAAKNLVEVVDFE